MKIYQWERQSEDVSQSCMYSSVDCDRWRLVLLVQEDYDINISDLGDVFQVILTKIFFSQSISHLLIKEKIVCIFLSYSLGGQYVLDVFSL